LGMEGLGREVLETGINGLQIEHLGLGRFWSLKLPDHQGGGGNQQAEGPDFLVVKREKVKKKKEQQRRKEGRKERKRHVVQGEKCGKSKRLRVE